MCPRSRFRSVRGKRVGESDEGRVGFTEQRFQKPVRMSFNFVIIYYRVRRIPTPAGHKYEGIQRTEDLCTRVTAVGESIISFSKQSDP